MNHATLIIEGQLARLKEEMKASQLRVERLVREINVGSIAVPNAEDVDGERLAQAAAELAAEQAQLSELKTRIRKLGGEA